MVIDDHAVAGLMIFLDLALGAPVISKLAYSGARKGGTRPDFSLRPLISAVAERTVRYLGLFVSGWRAGSNALTIL